MNMGLRMSPQEIEGHLSDLRNGVGSPILQGAAARAEEARLSQAANAASRASEANPDNSQLRVAADKAAADVTAFHQNEMAKVKNNFHGLGQGLQGEIQADLTTYNGLREQYLKDTGKPAPSSAEPLMRKTAKQMRDAVTADQDAMRNLGAAIDGMTVGRKLPGVDDVRTRIMAAIKDRPCVS
jgi:small-conductance mechanosensitive channel